MTGNFIGSIIGRLRRRRRERAERVLAELKIRYHTFRVILANNEAALNLLRAVEQSLRSPGRSGEELTEAIEELLSVVYELVDGLNRLTDNRQQVLYVRFREISTAVRRALAAASTQSTHGPRCIPFARLNIDQRHEVGGKAATLAALKQAGLPVPDGFAITARACAELLVDNGLERFIRGKLERLQEQQSPAAGPDLETAEIRRRILAATISREFENELRLAYELLTDGASKAVSVRSSALVEDRLEHSFAGQFQSVLNVTAFEALKTAVKEVIASNYSLRSIAYRLNAGLSPAQLDMAVFCQQMVPARTAGGLFTLDPVAPENGRMLISAVPGLGILAVSGSAPTDLYRPLRDAPERESLTQYARISAKTERAVSLAEGGVIAEELPEAEQYGSVLTHEEVLSLVRVGRMIDGLIGKPQDIEWAIDGAGRLSILQSRDIRLPGKSRQAAQGVRGKTLLSGGVCASPGRCVGVVKRIHSLREVTQWRGDYPFPVVAVLHQSLPEAARLLPECEGIVVDLGNPADHLSCVAREYSLPMLTGTGKATQVLSDGRWVILDADLTTVLEAPEEIWSRTALPRRTTAARRFSATTAVTPEHERLRLLIEPLNLTDAYGSTFSIQECKSLHDLIRYTHEMAVLAMFDLGDAVLEGAGMIVRPLQEGMPFDFLLIDLGGGLLSGSRRSRVALEDVLSAPLLALWKGMATPGLRWNRPPPAPSISGLFTRSILDGRSARPIGSQNYALITRDYLNLNARVDYHFAMVDAVCGSNPRENYIRFRFKGGGTNVVQRERRAQFVTVVLEAHGFYAERQGDLVTASIQETGREEIEERLIMVGRLLGFSRLLDASMSDAAMPKRIAQAFLDGDYALQSLSEQAAIR